MREEYINFMRLIAVLLLLLAFVLLFFAFRPPRPLSATLPAIATSSSQASTSPPQAAPSPPAPKLPAPVPSKAAWGVFLGDGAPQSVAVFSAQVGNTPQIIALFSPWSEPFPTYAQIDCTPGTTLLLFWENYGYSLDNIIAGAYDPYIEAFSAQAAQYPCPILLSLFHEMNGNWDDWDGTLGDNSPQKIIAAWQHVHALVTAQNVKWLWVVNNVSVPDVAGNEITDYYPGDAYVDAVGVDGFNVGNPWQSVEGVFDGALATVAQYHKPIYLSSVASVEGSGKAQWIQEFGAYVAAHPIMGWVWFDEDQPGTDWRINSDPTALAAFQSLVR